MKAVVFHAAKDVRVEDVPEPKVTDLRDAVVRVTASAICGSDLHLYNGFMPQRRPMVLGHEIVGVVDEVGSAVRLVRPGMRVAVMATLGCGECWFCARG